jgi:hypothetical protein
LTHSAYAIKDDGTSSGTDLSGKCIGDESEEESSDSALRVDDREAVKAILDAEVS